MYKYLNDADVPTLLVDLVPQEFDGANARECASYIAESLRDLEHVILVGTSCTGLIDPEVSMFGPIAHLVYVCAAFPTSIGRPPIRSSKTDCCTRTGLDTQAHPTVNTPQPWAILYRHPYKTGVGKHSVNPCLRRATCASLQPGESQVNDPISFPTTRDGNLRFCPSHIGGAEHQSRHSEWASEFPLSVVRHTDGSSVSPLASRRS